MTFADQDIRTHTPPHFIEDYLFLEEKIHITAPLKMPSYITSITAAQRLDSRGNPTVQVTLTTDKGIQSCYPEAHYFLLTISRHVPWPRPIWSKYRHS
jgi:hypothetical protein